MLLFYITIQVSSGFIISCMFLFTDNASLVRSTSTIVCLSARPFLGLVGEASPPPVCLLPRLTRSDSSRYCLFLQVVYQHLGGLLSLDSQPHPIWLFIWVIQSAFDGSPFPSQCPQHHWRGFRSFGKCTIVPTWDGWSVPSNFIGDFRSSLDLISTSSSVGGIFGIFIPYSTCFLGGYPKFSEGLIWSRERHPWKSSPFLLVLLSLDK